MFAQNSINDYLLYKLYLWCKLLENWRYLMTLQKFHWVTVYWSKYHLQYGRLESWLCNNATLLKPCSFVSTTVLWLLFAETKLYLKYPIKCQFDSHQLSAHKEHNNASSLPAIIVYNFPTTTKLCFLAACRNLHSTTTQKNPNITISTSKYK